MFLNGLGASSSAFGYNVKTDMVRAAQYAMSNSWAGTSGGSPNAWGRKMALAFGDVNAYISQPGIPHLSAFGSSLPGSAAALAVVDSLAPAWTAFLMDLGMPASGYLNTKAIPGNFGLVPASALAQPTTPGAPAPVPVVTQPAPKPTPAPGTITPVPSPSPSPSPIVTNPTPSPSPLPGVENPPSSGGGIVVPPDDGSGGGGVVTPPDTGGSSATSSVFPWALILAALSFLK